MWAHRGSLPIQFPTPSPISIPTTQPRKHHAQRASNEGLCVFMINGSLRPHMAICQYCSADYPDPVWPRTRSKYCSTDCNKRAYYDRHKDRLVAKAYQWCKDNRKKRLEVQRRWNATEGAKRSKQKWLDANKGKIYDKIKATGGIPLSTARGTSLRRLKRHQPHKLCVEPPPHKGRIECHHKDGNPFNTHVSNLEWRCKQHHVSVHRELRAGCSAHVQTIPASSLPDVHSTDRTDE